MRFSREKSRTDDTMARIEKSRAQNTTGMGLFSVITSVILFLTLLFIGLTAARLPSEYTEIDISDTGLYSLSEQTKNTVSALKDDAYIYWIVQSGNENREIEVLLARYRDLSSRLHVEKVDPIVNPGFAKQYTADSVNDNSLIVIEGNYSRYIDYEKIFVKSYNYFSDESSETVFDGENQLTSALDYVNSGIAPKLYRLTGHGEKSLSTALEDLIKSENYQIEKLSILGSENIPEDADCILIAGPTSDLTQTEADALEKYLSTGGRLLLYTDYEHTELPVLMSVLKKYNIEVESGLVLEGNQYMCYGNYPMQLLPAVEYHDITAPIVKGAYTVIVPMAHGLKLPEEGSDRITINSLLTTSSDAYAKEGRIESISRDNSDAAGPFSLGAAIEDGETNGRIVWYTSSDLLNKEYDELVNGTNSDLAVNSLSWLTEKDSSITIHSKKVSGNKLTVPSGAAARLGIVLIGIIPLTFLIIGAVISIRRRKR